jgi:hypothetical protein
MTDSDSPGQASVAERPIALPPVRREPPMLVIPFFTDQGFDAETRRILGVALELFASPCGSGDCDEDVKRAIAGQLIELSSDGERNPDLLCERALKRIRGEAA